MKTRVVAGFIVLVMCTLMMGCMSKKEIEKAPEKPPEKPKPPTGKDEQK